MERKVNLKGLFNNGDLNVTTSTVTETLDSNGVSAMFDNNLNTIYKFNHNVLPFPSVTLTFSKNILASKIFVKITTTNTDAVYLNVNNPATSNNLVGPIDNSGDTTTLSFSNLKSLNSINIVFASSLSSNPHIVNQLELYVLEESDPYEFNDSVLSTKAWNSSRYDGRQLQASQVNLATRNDVGNNNRTPIIQKYTRNIYLGSRIVGMNSSSIDDGTLTHFEGFSYVTMHEYLTINDDLSITRHSIRGNDETNVKKKGFYRSFYHDFPINSEAEIKIFDETIDDNLKSSYNIFNNSGQLQKMLLVERYDTDNTGSRYGVRYSGSNQLFYATSSTQNDLGAEFTIYNQQLIIDKFFTGSLISTPPAWTGGSNPDGGPANP